MSVSPADKTYLSQLRLQSEKCINNDYVLKIAFRLFFDWGVTAITALSNDAPYGLDSCLRSRTRPSRRTTFSRVSSFQLRRSPPPSGGFLFHIQHKVFVKEKFYTKKGIDTLAPLHKLQAAPYIEAIV